MPENSPQRHPDLEIINFSPFAPQWCWLAHAFDAPHWHHVSTQQAPLPTRLPKREMLARGWGAIKATRLAGQQRSVLVSHGPWPAMYSGLLAPRFCPDAPHLLYALNFTSLPKPATLKAMRKAFRGIQRFTVFSSMERALYAEQLEIPQERIDMIHWAANPLPVDVRLGRPMPGRYLCAIGSQGRDYDTLMKAMRMLPNIQLVVVAHAENVQHLDIPPNVTVRTSIPLSDVANIIEHSEFMVLPLAHGQVPCGHVTLVSAFHQGKPVVATDSAGVMDYLDAHSRGLLCEARNPDALKAAIQTLWEDPARQSLMGSQARTFALEHCSEASVTRYFSDFLSKLST